MRTRVRVIALCVLAAACATVQIPRPTEEDARRAAAARPGTSVAELDRGRALYVSRCASCHRLRDPRSERAESWPERVDEMRKRARLNAEEADLLVLYLMTMASSSPDSPRASAAHPSAPKN